MGLSLTRVHDRKEVNKGAHVNGRMHIPVKILMLSPPIKGLRVVEERIKSVQMDQQQKWTRNQHPDQAVVVTEHR